MNKARRKAIEELMQEVAFINTDIEVLKERASSVKENLEGLKDEEQDYYDNMPEGFQNGEKGQKAEEIVSELDTIIEGLQAIEDLEEVTAEIDLG